MALPQQYQAARRDEDVARLRRIFALRAMVATGMSQRRIAEALGVSQPAVSQQLKSSPDLTHVHPEILLAAATPVLKELAEERGFTRLAAFGSVARRRARQDCDIDLLVESPEGTSTFAFIRFKRLIEEVLGREIDLVDSGCLTSQVDDDSRREAALL